MDQFLFRGGACNLGHGHRRIKFDTGFSRIVTSPATVGVHLVPGEGLRLDRMPRVVAVAALTLDVFPASRLMGINEGFSISGHMAGHAVVTELVTRLDQRLVGIRMRRPFPESRLLRMATGTRGRSQEVGDGGELEGLIAALLVTGRADKRLHQHFHLGVPSDVWSKCCDRKVGNIASCGRFLVPDVMPLLALGSEPEISSGKFGTLTTGLEENRPLMETGFDVLGDPGDFCPVMGVGFDDDVNSRNLRCESIHIPAIDMTEDDTQIKFAPGLVDLFFDRFVGVAELCVRAMLADKTLVGDLDGANQKNFTTLTFDDGASTKGARSILEGHVGTEEWKLEFLRQLEKAIETQSHIVLAQTDCCGSKAVVGIDKQFGFFVHLFHDQRIGTQLVEVKEPVSTVNDARFDALGFQ